MALERQTKVSSGLPYIQLVKAGIAQFASSLRAELKDEHPYVREAVECYLSILEAGGKRMRGSLSICSYELYGGTDTELISLVAGIIEGLHAYLLVIDDIADNATTRRGRPTAQYAMESYLQKRHISLNVWQPATDMVISGALTGQHKAQLMLSGLDIDPVRRLRILTIVNEHLVKTGLGQLLDMTSSIGVPMDINTITSIAYSKTAYYTFQMPLEVGAILAGASETSMKVMSEYSLHAGLAFQLQDDIMGVFGDEKKMGKSVKSDIIEGKQTLLTAYAIENATKAQRDTFQHALGNPSLTDEAFKDCQGIMISTGALDKVRQLANREVILAHEVLDNVPSKWPAKNVDYLRKLASFAAHRDI